MVRSEGKNSQIIKREGRVTEALPNAFFRIVLEDGKEILGFLSGKMRMNRITILPGDKVSVEMTPYDEERDGFTLFAKRILNTNKDKVNLL